MSKIAPEDEAKFIISMIDRDLFMNAWDRSQKLDYLTIVADHIAKTGNDLVDEQINGPPIGEDRPEKEDSDIEMSFHPDMEHPLIKAINELLRIDYDREYGVKSKTPIEFIDGARCLTGPKAGEWLYRNKIMCSSEHIHTFEDTWYAIIKDDEDVDLFDCECVWLEEDGTMHTSDIVGISQIIFNKAYLPSLERIDAQDS